MTLLRSHPVSKEYAIQSILLIAQFQCYRWDRPYYVYDVVHCHDNKHHGRFPAPGLPMTRQQYIQGAHEYNRFGLEHESGKHVVSWVVTPRSRSVPAHTTITKVLTGSPFNTKDQWAEVMNAAIASKGE